MRIVGAVRFTSAQSNNIQIHCICAGSAAVLHAHEEHAAYLQVKR